MIRTRRRRLMLVSASVLGAACNRGEAASKDALGSDSALVARLQRDSVTLASASVAPTDGAAVCRQSLPTPAAATAQRQQEADLQLQLAREAELAGDQQGARDALRRAARLDPTNQSIAQRLARASEALGDASAAVEEYCRALALAPSPADSTAVTARLRALAAYPAGTTAPAAAAAPTQVAAGTAVPADTGSARRASRPANRSASHPARRRVANAVTPSGKIVTETRGGTVERERTNEPERRVAAADTSDSVVAAPATPATPDTTMYAHMIVTPDTSIVAAAPQPTPATAQPAAAEPAAEQPAPAARRRSGVSGRNVMTGAAVGAVLGAAVGRNVQSAVIGAAAGGVLGGVVRPRYRTGSTVPRGIVGWGGN